MTIYGQVCKLNCWQRSFLSIKLPLLLVKDELRLENLSERYLFDTGHSTGEASTYDDGRFMSTQFCYSTIVNILWPELFFKF